MPRMEEVAGGGGRPLEERQQPDPYVLLLRCQMTHSFDNLIGQKLLDLQSSSEQSFKSRDHMLTINSHFTRHLLLSCQPLFPTLRTYVDSFITYLLQLIHSLARLIVSRCYVPISQVNSVSISVHLVMFLQTQTVVCDLTKHTPPCSLQISLPVNSHINPSPSLPVTSARLMSMDFITTPLYLMDSAFSEWPHTELLPR